MSDNSEPTFIRLSYGVAYPLARMTSGHPCSPASPSLHGGRVQGIQLDRGGLVNQGDADDQTRPGPLAQQDTA